MIGSEKTLNHHLTEIQSCYLYYTEVRNCGFRSKKKNKGFKDVWDYEMGIGVCPSETSSEDEDAGGDKNTPRTSIDQKKEAKRGKGRKGTKDCSSQRFLSKTEEEPLISWEDQIFHNLQIIDILGTRMSPTLWPRHVM